MESWFYVLWLHLIKLRSDNIEKGRVFDKKVLKAFILTIFFDDFCFFKQFLQKSVVVCLVSKILQLFEEAVPFALEVSHYDLWLFIIFIKLIDVFIQQLFNPFQAIYFVLVNIDDHPKVDLVIAVLFDSIL